MIQLTHTYPRIIPPKLESGLKSLEENTNGFLITGGNEEIGVGIGQ